MMTVKEGALDWLHNQVADPLIEKTFDPEAISFFQHLNHIFEIPWALMLAQVLLIAGIGVCGYVAAEAVDQRPIGRMIALTTVACCLSSIVTCVKG